MSRCANCILSAMCLAFGPDRLANNLRMCDRCGELFYIIPSKSPVPDYGNVKRHIAKPPCRRRLNVRLVDLSKAGGCSYCSTAYNGWKKEIQF